MLEVLRFTAVLVKHCSSVDGYGSFAIFNELEVVSKLKKRVDLLEIIDLAEQVLEAIEMAEEDPVHEEVNEESSSDEDPVHDEVEYDNPNSDSEHSSDEETDDVEYGQPARANWAGIVNRKRFLEDSDAGSD